MDKNSLHLNEPFYLDSRGRYRDKKTHRYVKQEIIQKHKNQKFTNVGSNENMSFSQEAKEAAKRQLLETVIQEGIHVKDVADAWGCLVSVQAQIAMDASNGSKATNAAKFIGMVTGLLEEDLQKPLISKVVLGRGLAQKLLTIIDKLKSGD
jgi:hypothetical protein